jgi:hypothetical protein
MSRPVVAWLLLGWCPFPGLSGLSGSAAAPAG